MKKYLNFLSILTLSLLFSTQEAFADMLPPGNFDKIPKDERTKFFDIIEPQYIIIGITVIIGIIVSFALIAKLRDSEEESESE